MGALQKVTAQFRGRSLREGATHLAQSLGAVIEQRRASLLLAVDLTEAKNRWRPRDESTGITLKPLDRGTRARLLTMLEAEAPAEAPRVERRFRQAMPGLVAAKADELLGFVFWVPGSSDPAVTAHPDLLWLGLRPGHQEVYCFDYFLKEGARGQGAPFVRAVQERHHQLGYQKAYGYVHTDNTPALWLYRTNGWKEIGRVEETRWLSRLAVVDHTLYWMEPYARRPLFRGPGSATVRRR